VQSLPRRQLRIRSSAKSIAPSRLHPPKNLRGGLRGDTLGWCTKSLLKIRVRCKACHAEERAAFRSTPPPPLPPLRKINCSLQNALAEKAAWWAAVQSKAKQSYIYLWGLSTYWVLNKP